MPRRYRRSDQVRDAQKRALGTTGPTGPRGRIVYDADGMPTRTVFSDVSGNCMSPVLTLDWGRVEGSRTRVVSGTATASNFMERLVPCRKCDNCLERRGYHWRMRALQEAKASARTWLGTLTLDPGVASRALSLCRDNMRKQGIDYDALPDADKFRQLDDLMYREFQKRVKLLRKNTEAPFRYLCVTEAHKSGLPHWHVLMHERDPLRPIRYDADWLGRHRPAGSRKWVQLRDPFWCAGFQRWDLVEARAAAYVCKYLSKSLDARVRASQRYGLGCESPYPSETEVSVRSVAAANVSKVLTKRTDCERPQRSEDTKHK